jgi:selenocysteine lyase/cysteine desulfurase
MNIRVAEFPDIAPGVELDDHARETIRLLASGGDARILLDPATGLNRYLSAPYPRRTLAYASSTANDLSPAAFAHACACLRGPEADYADRLEALRGRIRAAYALEEMCEIVFAPSGTDLEYVALAAVRGRAPEGIHNVLLGADEVGSGCIHSAHGRFFAAETALGIPARPGAEVSGIGHVSLADVPVRCAEGLARTSRDVADSIALEVELARSMGRHALVHVVHGSKTGLILPELAEIDALIERFGKAVSFVVDACQARITTGALQRYLERGAIVFLTGSKFMGGAPFNGFALVPSDMASGALTLPQGLAQIFRRAEWPEGWAGREGLADENNPGLWLRLESAVFELERFQRLTRAQIERIITAFQQAVERELARPLGLPIVAPTDVEGGEEPRVRPVEMLTLVTLDVSRLPAARTFALAQEVHQRMALAGVRLGQPAKCVRRDGEWGGTLRVGLSMPQFSAWAALDDAALSARLCEDMARIAHALRAAT